MGQLMPNEFKNRHFLHNYKFFENKLNIYFPGSDHPLVFEIYNRGKPYQFFTQESISLPNGSIYLIGGRVLTEKTSKLNEDIIESVNQEISRPSHTLAATAEVVKINLNKHKNMKIELSKSKSRPPLPEPRNGHLLIYSAPFIYVIGGKIDEITPTSSCLRFHLKKLTWSPIADLDFDAMNVSNLSGLAITPQKPSESSKYLYIFNSTSEKLPSISQYDIELDRWTQLVIANTNRDLNIPSSINLSVYQIGAETLLILSGNHINGEEQREGYSYVFNLKSQKIRKFKMEKNLDFMLTDKQGVRSYRNTQRVFLNFGENYALYYHTGIEELISVQLNYQRANRSGFGFGCCSKRS